MASVQLRDGRTIHSWQTGLPLFDGRLKLRVVGNGDPRPATIGEAALYLRAAKPDANLDEAFSGLS